MVLPSGDSDNVRGALIIVMQVAFIFLVFRARRITGAGYLPPHLISAP